MINRGDDFFMRMTFGMNIAKENIKFKNLTKHIYRKNRFQDKNKNINWNFTPYNKTVHLANEKKLVEQHCGNYVKKYNHRQILQGHKKRCYKSAWDYFKKHGKHATRCVTFTIGSKHKRNLLEREVLKKIRAFNSKDNSYTRWDKARKYMRTKMEPKAIINEFKMFNKNNPNLKILDGVVHCDEGIMHGHANVLALPLPTNTKHHRPSFSFSKAVREDGDSNDGRKALHNLENQQGKNAMKTLSDAFDNAFSFQLERTGNATKLSGNEYKKYAKNRDSASAERKRVSSATSKARSVSTMAVKISQATSTIAHRAYFTGSTSGSKANESSARSLASSLNTSSANSLQSLQNQLNLLQSRIITKSKKASKASNAALSTSNSIKTKASSLSNQEQTWHSFLSQQISIADPKLNSETCNWLADGKGTMGINNSERSGVDLLTNLIGSQLNSGIGKTRASRVASNFYNYGSLTSSEFMARKRNLESNLGNSGDELQ